MIDIITAAIVSAVATKITADAPGLIKKGVSEAYDSLKHLIAKKFGHDSDLVQAIAKVEADPTSEGRKAVLNEEVSKSKALHDPDVMSAAEKLTTLLSTVQNAHSTRQVAIGNYIAEAAGHSSATVHLSGTVDKAAVP